jgi:hypothetical protein
MAELCERHGLVLAEARVTSPTHPSSGRLAERVRRRLRGSQWATVGISTIGSRRTRRVEFGRVAGVLHGLWWPRRRFLGETFIYVVRRADNVALP